MGNSMAIDKDQVGFLLQLLPGGDQRRVLAKREKSGDIGHGGADTGDLILHQLE
ncbi:hypothetical protein D3C78_1865030 [compost metagenome]